MQRFMSLCIIYLERKKTWNHSVSNITTSHSFFAASSMPSCVSSASSPASFTWAAEESSIRWSCPTSSWNGFLTRKNWRNLLCSWGLSPWSSVSSRGLHHLQSSEPKSAFTTGSRSASLYSPSAPWRPSWRARSARSRSLKRLPTFPFWSCCSLRKRESCSSGICEVLHPTFDLVNRMIFHQTFQEQSLDSYSSKMFWRVHDLVKIHNIIIT